MNPELYYFACTNRFVALIVLEEAFARVIMESTAYVVKDNILVFKELGLKVKEIISLGGGAKSDLWCLIKADILNKKVAQLKNPEVS